MSDTDKTGAAGQPEVPAADAVGPSQATGSAAAAGGPAPPIDIDSVIEARVRELESQQADLTDRLLRAHAEMENLRKRTEREKSDSAKYAITKFALDIVGISDNFQRAVAAVPAGESEGALKSLLEGVTMTERAFLQVLERHGVRQIDPQGEPFNPNLHQAVMEQETAEVPAGMVLKVFQSGYMIEDRILRPAMVVVARGGAKPDNQGAEPAPGPGGTGG